MGDIFSFLIFMLVLLAIAFSVISHYIAMNSLYRRGKKLNWLRWLYGFEVFRFLFTKKYNKNKEMLFAKRMGLAGFIIIICLLMLAILFIIFS